MRAFLYRAAAVAVVILILDELLKSIARSSLKICSVSPITNCDRLELVGPLLLVRTANAGSALGFRQGLWIWVVLAAVGILLIPIYARWLGWSNWSAALAVGLQLGGAMANLLDRIVFGGASDVFYVGGAYTWNLADIALAAGTLLATWALLRTRVAKHSARAAST